MKLPFLNVELEVGSKYLTTELRDSSGILGDHDALQARMAADGYLLLRGLHDRDHVLSARRHILEKLSERGMLDAGAPLADGIFNPGYDEPPTSGAITRTFCSGMLTIRESCVFRMCGTCVDDQTVNVPSPGRYSAKTPRVSIALGINR